MTILITLQIIFTEAFKSGRASPAGKGVLASTTCCSQTPGAPGQLYPGWTLALKMMMEMKTSNRDALLTVLPRTSHRACWCHRAADAWEHLLFSLGIQFGGRISSFCRWEAEG